MKVRRIHTTRKGYVINDEVFDVDDTSNIAVTLSGRVRAVRYYTDETDEIYWERLPVEEPETKPEWGITGPNSIDGVMLP